MNALVGVYDKRHLESSDGSDLEMVAKKGKTYSGDTVYSLLSENESDDNSMLEEWDGSTASSNASEERIGWSSTYLSSLGRHNRYFLSGIWYNSFVKLML